MLLIVFPQLLVWIPGLMLQLQSSGSLTPGSIGKMLGGRGVKRGDEVSSGGRLSRRNADPLAEAERKAQQEKLYSLDLDRVLAGWWLLISVDLHGLVDSMAPKGSA